MLINQIDSFELINNTYLLFTYLILFGIFKNILISEPKNIKSLTGRVLEYSG